MRPAARPRHIVAVLILALVAGIYGYLAMYDRTLDDWQIRLATVAVKDQPQQDLYPHDLVFGESGLWRGHSLLFQAILKMVLVPTGYQDLILPYRVMVGVLSMIFLCGMYALLYRQCLSWAVATFVAILSSTVTSTLAGCMWGFGSLARVTPAGMCMTFLPLVVLVYLRNATVSPVGDRRGRRKPWRILLVFGAIGLLGNLHLASTMNLTLVLVIAYLWQHRLRLRSWPIALACIAVSALGALPQIAYSWALRSSLASGGDAVSAGVVLDALRIARLDVLFPQLVRDLLDWLVSCMILAILAGAVMIRFERFKCRNLGLWLSMGTAAVILAVGGHSLLILAASLWGGKLVVVDFLQAAPLAMLPLYVLSAQTLTNLFRLGYRHRSLQRWACLVLLIAWMLPSDNLHVVRHKSYEVLTMPMREEDRPVHMRKRMERLQRHSEMIAISKWVGNDTNTPGDAVCIIDDIEFRMWSRRSIVVGDDLQWVYYYAPGRLPQWLELLKRQRMLLYPSTGKADPEALRQFTRDLTRQKNWQGVTHWYVVLDAEVAPEESAWLKYVRDEQWGRYLVLARVQ